MDTLATILGWLLWVFTAFIAATWTFGVVTYMRRPTGVTYGSIFMAMLAWMLTLVFVFSSLNKLHLLWLIPVCWFGSVWLHMSIAMRPRKHETEAERKDQT